MGTIVGRHCKSLTIFEGCDGTGKSTEAKRYAEMTDAKYVHFPALKQVTGGALGRMYVESMLPALLGYQDVVFDRSWLSEIPYGTVFRQGADRLKMSGQRRLLERLAMRCGALVVRCDPGWDSVLKSFMTGREEMLDNTKQLRQVYDLYGAVDTYLPILEFSYTLNKHGMDPGSVMTHRMPHHQIAHDTTGNLEAENVVLFDGGKIPERTDVDTFNLWASSQLSNKSLWGICKHMDTMGQSEKNYLWLNIDSPTKALIEYMSEKRLYAFGDRAHEFLKQNNQPGQSL